MGGAWDTPANWSTGAVPEASDVVLIMPANAQMITGSSLPITIESLIVSAQPGGMVQFQTQPSGPLTISGILSVESLGTLRVNGIVNSLTGTENQGRLELVSGSLFSGGPLLNAGVVTGSGQFATTLTNQAGGEVRVEAGQRIVVSGSGSTNAGRIQVVGGEIEFRQALTNQGAGTLYVRDATLRFGGGLTNEGTLGVSFGTTDISGAINNSTASSKIILSGNSNTTFYDDVSNAGLIKVSAGSTAVFFGDLQGTDPTGTGKILIEGGQSSGAGASVQLMGVAAGSVASPADIQNDSDVGLIVSGTQTIGVLEGAGSTTVLAGGALTATSVVQNTLTIGAGGSVTIRETVDGAAASPVPEPGTWVLIGIGLLSLLAFRRRR